AQAAPLDALNGGYHAAFAFGAAFAAAAALIGLALRIRPQNGVESVGPAMH
ncbi:MFS transporter, partial [Burkholderia sp. DN3021]